jgi:hypothetical protein
MIVRRKPRIGNLSRAASAGPIAASKMHEISNSLATEAAVYSCFQGVARSRGVVTHRTR